MLKYRTLTALCIIFIASISWAEVKIASDITRLGVGARPLGMGKMFTGISDDISAMYLNPAGLAKQDTLQVLSMSGKFVNLVDYITLATSFPFAGGTAAVGYASAGLGFSTPVLNLVEIATGEYRVIPSTTETVSYNYGNSAVCLAYGQTLFRPDLSFGANLKMFTENISGASGANARGYDLDLGILFTPNSNLTLGLLGKNVLPANLGGKIVWSTNLEETYPAKFNLGASLKLGKFTIGSDYEWNPNTPGLFHTGIEWWPIEIFGARAGIDQDTIGKDNGSALEAVNNLTSGISLKFADFRFDYAYHRYNDISENDTHYFSLVYQPPKIIPLTILTPQDKLITREATVIVKGKASDRRIKTLKINDQEVTIKKGEFETEVSLLPGKNIIRVTALDSKGKVISSKPLRILRLRTFPDVPVDHWAREPIEFLSTLDIMLAYSDGNFRPEEKINRYNLLLNLLNIGRIPPATKLEPFPFKDVAPKEKIAPYVKAGYDEKLILGYPNRTFRPWQKSSRLEAILLLVRFSKVPFAEARERPFKDISARHWAIKEISSAKEKNMLKFVLEELTPSQNTTRAEFAYMLSKTPQISEKIEELLNFEIGY